MRRGILYATTAIFLLGTGAVIWAAGHNTLPEWAKALWRVPGGDKIGHFLILCALSALINLSLRNRTWPLWRWQVLVGSALVASFITLEELSQALIPHRTFDLLDLSANYLGVLCGGWVARRVQARAAQKTQ
jgi:VanZ family protein